MSATIKISESAAQILRTFQTMPDWVRKALARAMDQQNLFTTDHIRKDYLQFSRTQPPTPIGCRHITGRLYNSIRPSKAVVSGERISSSIGSNVVYAAPLEFGAVIPPHKIVPKNGKALRFTIGGRVVFAKSVNFPGATIQGRHFVQRGIEDRAADYSNAFSKAIVDGWNNQPPSNNGTAHN